MRNSKEQGGAVSIELRYLNAQNLEQGVFTKKVASNTTLYPHWIRGADVFWYMRDTKDNKGELGVEYRLVNAGKVTNDLAFDHEMLANTLGEVTGQKIDYRNLPLNNVEISLFPLQVSFDAFGERWKFDEGLNRCEVVVQYPVDWLVSPDGKLSVFVRDYNLWLRDLENNSERALTTDGEKFNVYAGTPTVYGRNEAPSLEVIWSADSKKIFTHLIDTRNIGRGAPLVQHVPSDGSLRPVVLNPERRVALPEDDIIEAYQFLAIDIESEQIQFASYQSSPVCYPPYAGFFSGHKGWWDKDCRHAYFFDQVRGGKVLRLVKFDTCTGAAQVLIEESSDFAVTLIPVTHMCPLSMALPESNELIWSSEREGVTHLYLYDLVTGLLKNPITAASKPKADVPSRAPQWLVRNILYYNSKSRELYIQTAGRIPGRNPYYCDICRVNIDTGVLTEVISTDHEYVVCDQRTRISFGDRQAQGVSPCGRYVVATRSRVDAVPVSLLLDKDGRELLEIEVADISGLPDTWQWPEPMMLKAADGVTDIYAVVFRPSDFDPSQTYPVLDCTFAYSAPVGSFTNTNTGNWHYLSAAAYAELGFIVVMINNRGNEGLRDTEFNNYQDPVLPLEPNLLVKYNKADCVAGIEQLAEQYPYIDISRVGIAEFGSVPTAMAGMLLYPDFYKVGVSNNAMMDWRLLASLGMNASDSLQLEDLAINLKGKLLMIAGMLDDVMPVSMTFRMVEALQKENKFFDMLLLPNLGHYSSGYTTKRSWDYFVEHLLGVNPPVNFRLTTGAELLLAELGGN